MHPVALQLNQLTRTGQPQDRFRTQPVPPYEETFDPTEMDSDMSMTDTNAFTKCCLSSVSTSYGSNTTVCSECRNSAELINPIGYDDKGKPVYAYQEFETLEINERKVTLFFNNKTWAYRLDDFTLNDFHTAPYVSDFPSREKAMEEAGIDINDRLQDAAEIQGEI
jgi:hypothetical protein